MLLSEILVKRLTFPFPAVFGHRSGSTSKCAKIKDNRMPDLMSVRCARASDLDAILAIEHASFGLDAYDRKLFAELLHKCGGMFLVAFSGNRVIGYSVCCINFSRAELVSIAVAPRHRKQGVASALLASTLRRLRRRGVERITLMAKVTNQAAIAFYGKFGFRKLRRVARYYEDGSDGFLFVAQLAAETRSRQSPSKPVC